MEAIKMQITDIKVRKIFDDDSPMKAIVSITLDNQLALHDIKVIHAREKMFIVMPSRKNPDNTYRDIVHPLNSAFRAELETAIISAYKKELELRKQVQAEQPAETQAAGNAEPASEQPAETASAAQ